MHWRFLHIGPEGDSVEIEGTRLWCHEWRRQGEVPIAANHPEHPDQLHSLDRYFVQADGKIVEFAASQVSEGDWLFWVPAPDSTARKAVLKVAAYGLVTVGVFIGLRGWSADPVRYGTLGAILVLLGFAAQFLSKSRLANSDA